ncbi:MAG: CoA pyrophosphatase [Chloroflexi bacterium]|nr:CoA pyrophosphatase [Chloroflexota bacterium]
MRTFPTDDKVRAILAARKRFVVRLEGLRPAAVFVLLCGAGSQQAMVFNVRTSRVEYHKGEISFPGGAQDARDETLLDAALREAHEEIGVRPEDVVVLGQLDDTFTRGSGFRITPFVGRIPSPYSFSPNPHEVEEVFAVPLRYLLEHEISPEESLAVAGRVLAGPSWLYDGHLIWGATARIVKQLLDTVCR